MTNNNKYSVFSEYDFIRLYCALNIKKGKNPLLIHGELEKKLYNFYDIAEFKILFEDMKVAKDYDIEDNRLVLTTAIQTAQTFGLLVSIQGAGNIRSMICCDKEQSDQIISNYADEVVSKMDNLLDSLENFKENNRTETKEKQKFTVLAVPCKRAFVVSREKSEEFKKLTNTKRENAFVRKIAETFRKNNLVEDKPKVKKLGQKLTKNNYR